MKKIVSIIIALLLAFNITAYAAEYVVQPGDTFWIIAQKHSMPLDELIATNPQIADPSNIWTGLVINIPDRYVTPSPSPSPTPTPEVNISRESLTYLYAGTTTTYIKTIDSTNRSLKTICPDYFDIDSSGNLLITPSNKIDPAFIDEMHSRGILVTPFISNHWDRALGNTALDNREALSTQVADMIARYNLDGINIDIENVNEQYRAAYTDFTRLLRQKLPADKIVAVAVAANPHGWNTGWHGSYDYKALSDHSDYLMIMAYDESYHGSPAGPVSGSTFFENSIKYAINQGVPRSKIVVGLPFFGRYWKQGEAVGGIGITSNDIQYLIENYSSSYRYDTATQSANVTVTIHPSDPEPKIWGGRVLTAGVYDIWYDDLLAVQFKLDMINSYGIKGAGSWALGQENPDIWSFYTAALNGTTGLIPSPTLTPPPTIAPTPTVAPTTPPVHTPTPTVAPTSTPVPTSIPTPPPVAISNTQKILNAVNGNGNTRTVTTSSTLTRGEAAVLLAELTNLTPEPDTDTFADTADYWGKGHVNALRRRGIIEGVGSNNYNPNSTMTRGDLCVILDRLLVIPNTIDYHTADFKDVSRSSVWYNPVSKLYYFDIVIGKNKNFFEPETGITVEHMAIILDRIDKNQYPMNPDKHMSNISPRSATPPDADALEPIIEPR